jgi:hypothetical protein
LKLDRPLPTGNPNTDRAVSAVQENVRRIDDRVSAVETTLSAKQKTSTDGLAARIDAVENNMGILDANKASVSYVDGQVTGLDGRLDGVETIMPTKATMVSSPAVDEIMASDASGNLKKTGFFVSLLGTITSKVVGLASSVSGNLIAFGGTDGKSISDTGIVAANVMQGPVSAVTDEIMAFANGTGKLAKSTSKKLSDVMLLDDTWRYRNMIQNGWFGIDTVGKLSTTYDYDNGNKNDAVIDGFSGDFWGHCLFKYITDVPTIISPYKGIRIKPKRLTAETFGGLAFSPTHDSTMQTMGRSRYLSFWARTNILSSITHIGAFWITDYQGWYTMGSAMIGDEVWRKFQYNIGSTFKSFDIYFGSTWANSGGQVFNSSHYLDICGITMTTNPNYPDIAPDGIMSMSKRYQKIHFGRNRNLFNLTASGSTFGTHFGIGVGGNRVIFSVPLNEPIENYTFRSVVSTHTLITGANPSSTQASVWNLATGAWCAVTGTAKIAVFDTNMQEINLIVDGITVTAGQPVEVKCGSAVYAIIESMWAI